MINIGRTLFFILLATVSVAQSSSAATKMAVFGVYNFKPYRLVGILQDWLTLDSALLQQYPRQGVLLVPVGSSKAQVEIAMKNGIGVFLALHDQSGEYDFTPQRPEVIAPPGTWRYPKISTTTSSVIFIEISAAMLDEILDASLAGTECFSKKQKIEFLWRGGGGPDGKGYGTMDYQIRILPPEVQFVKLSDKLYDRGDFGNFLWGAALQRIKVFEEDAHNLTLAVVGSQGNDFINACKQNVGMEECRGLPMMPHWKFDSPIDQAAIRKGFAWEQWRARPPRVCPKAP